MSGLGPAFWWAGLDNTAHLHQTDPDWAAQPKNPRVVLRVVQRLHPHFDGVIVKELDWRKGVIVLTKLEWIITPVSAIAPIN